MWFKEPLLAVITIYKPFYRDFPWQNCQSGGYWNVASGIEFTTLGL
jgi:hypothetical protein